jgi:hypothetical protein
MELAITICLANSGFEDESCFHQEDHVVEVYQALGCKSAESPTWHASCRYFTTDSLP